MSHPSSHRSAPALIVVKGGVKFWIFGFLVATKTELQGSLWSSIVPIEDNNMSFSTMTVPLSLPRISVHNPRLFELIAKEEGFC